MIDSTLNALLILFLVPLIREAESILTGIATIIGVDSDVRVLITESPSDVRLNLRNDRRFDNGELLRRPNDHWALTNA